MSRYEINIEIEGNISDPPQRTWLRRVSREVLAAQGVAAAEMGLVIADEETMQRLNRDYRGIDATTDVLAFSLQEASSADEAFVTPPDGLTHLGEVIICHPQAQRQALEQGHSLDRELAILLIHGILHLLRYDHETPEQEPRMRAEEQRILSLLEEKGLVGGAMR